MRRIFIFALFLCIASSAFANHIETLFYLTTLGAKQIQSINVHAQGIDILAPQDYEVNPDGTISGAIDPQLLTLAKTKHLKLMPLVINTNFDQAKLHTLLHNKDAEERAIDHMLLLCETFHYSGLQFDFENIHVNDKAAFTRFYQLAANRLHQHGFIISVAIVPHTSESMRSDYDRWVYENWTGAYDYQALGQSSDFVTLMSYDKHTTLTTPGPIAAADWVEKTIQTMLRYIPAKKISLGVPAYSGYWSTGKMGAGNVPEKYVFRSKETQIAYGKAENLLAQYNQTLAWQDKWKSSYVMFENDEKTEYLFVEDAKAFAAKEALVKHYNLRGISVWKLGLEDPQIWSLSS